MGEGCNLCKLTKRERERKEGKRKQERNIISIELLCPGLHHIIVLDVMTVPSGYLPVLLLKCLVMG